MSKFIKIFLTTVITVFAFSYFAEPSFAQCDPTNPGEVCFTNPLEYDTVEGFLMSVLNTLRAIIVVLSLVFIVIGAIIYIVSSGNERVMTMGKRAILGATIGLAIGLAAPSFLKEIYNVMGASTDPNVQCAGLEGEAMDECQRALEDSLTLSQIALNVLNFLLGVVGVIAIIMLVIAGISYSTAAGDDDRIKTAKNMTKWSIVGIAVALGAIVIVRQIASFFG
ncbi:MAG: hypothetical protein PHH24_02440 [Candidatus Moranbacteria bacterium]|jgi:hypothetical protein|nr:hypothetical protein [Candidatus Moranbacteria bacterium]MDD5652163.1 hypothetical protein [Candidatus Moranbacteria bacterium]MDX9855844.1 hypothetical protein [Candidatus Moranbacteria bacterium]